jgi:DNA replication protein DnaC
MRRTEPTGPDFKALAAEWEAEAAKPAPCPGCGGESTGGSRPILCASCKAAAETAKFEQARADRLASLARSWLRVCPARYAWADFAAPEMGDRVKDPKAVALAQKANATTSTLVGGAGAGKTSLAAAMGRHRTMAGKSPWWVRAVDLATARRAMKLGEGETELVRRALSADVLVLDDIGAEDQTQFSKVVAEVIHARHDDMLDTIVTTGFAEKAIGERYGDGIARRLFEECVIQVRKAGTR